MITLSKLLLLLFVITVYWGEMAHSQEVSEKCQQHIEGMHHIVTGAYADDHNIIMIQVEMMAEDCGITDRMGFFLDIISLKESLK